MPLPRVLAGLAACLLVAVATEGEGGQGAANPATRIAILQVEDSRAATPGQLQLLLQAATSATPDLQVVAVRALGRLERPDLLPQMLPLLEAGTSAVRAEAANALAQAAGKDVERVRLLRARLLERLVGEVDAEARGAICEALGRLPYSAPADITQAERAIVEAASRTQVTRHLGTRAAGGNLVGVTIAPTTEVSVPVPAILGALRGLEALSRARAKVQPALLPETIERLKALALTVPAAPTGRARERAAADAARIRRLALLCLVAAGEANETVVRRALADPDVQVRRLAVSSPSADRTSVVDRGLKDPSWLVRYAALRAYGRRFQPTEGCGPIVAAIGATVDHVSMLAVDLLANPCQPGDHAVETLLDLAASVTPSTARSSAGRQGGAAGLPRADWHWGAHAIVALAKASPERSKPMLARYLTTEPWQPRMYAARAAAELADADALRALARDANPNVCEAAVSGLARTARHEADAIYVQALGADDHQLIRTAAAALAGTPDRAAAVPALLAALARLTTKDSETSRDPRVALLERLGELGSRVQAESLTPYLRDHDPRVAELAARIVSGWTGVAVNATPTPRAEGVAPVTATELSQLASTTVRVTMRDRGQFDLRMLADVAPMSCVRFVRLVGQGYYNGLTFHRVIPDFVIQGGSPGANEYSGADRYWRDEVGRAPQLRGTVGSSTRGRDTGDAQIYVNLVDSLRLDHEYTIFAEVSRGMDVVDSILEGDVIQKMQVMKK